MSKSKPCFKILGKKAFRWHLKTWENQIGSIFKLNIKKKMSNSKNKSLPCPLFPNTFHHHPLNINFFPGGGGGGRLWEEGAGKIFFFLI
jgi:hypothetical protein